MDIQKKPTLAEKQTFWAEQLPNFESKYWLPSHFEFLAFDMDHGNYVIKDDLDPRLEDDANEIFHRVNTGWAMWKKAVNFTVNEAKAQAVPKGYCVVPIESLEESLDWAGVAKWDSPSNARDEEINKHEEIIRAIVEAQEQNQ